MKNLLWILQITLKDLHKGFNSTADSIPGYKNKCHIGWFMFFCIELIY